MIWFAVVKTRLLPKARIGYSASSIIGKMALGVSRTAANSPFRRTNLFITIAHQAFRAHLDPTSAVWHSSYQYSWVLGIYKKYHACVGIS